MHCTSTRHTTRHVGQPSTSVRPLHGACFSSPRLTAAAPASATTPLLRMAVLPYEMPYAGAAQLEAPIVVSSDCPVEYWNPRASPCSLLGALAAEPNPWVAAHLTRSTAQRTFAASRPHGPGGREPTMMPSAKRNQSEFFSSEIPGPTRWPPLSRLPVPPGARGTPPSRANTTRPMARSKSRGLSKLFAGFFLRQLTRRLVQAG